MRCLLLAAFMLLAGSCGGHVSAASFASLVAGGQLSEEDAIERVCARAALPPDGAERDALAQARRVAERQARAVLCHALGCGPAKACQCAPDAHHASVIRFAEGMDLSAEQKSVMASMGIEHDVSFEGAWTRAKDALGKPESAAKVFARLNLARAGLVVLLRLADEAQSLADAVAASFGWFQGFAQPLLRRVAAEAVAAAMTEGVDALMKQHVLPQADLTREACAFYARRDPRASVGDRLLRRLILRFAPRQVRAAIGKMKQNECERLDTAVDILDRGVCRRIQQDLALDDGGVALREPPAEQEQENKTIDDSRWAQGRHFALTATSCFEVNPGDPWACSIDRVTAAASYSYLLSNHPGSERPRSLPPRALPFAQVHGRLQAMENDVATLRNEAGQQRAGAAGRDRAGEGLVSVLQQQSEQIRRLEDRVAFFAKLASEACKKKHTELQEKRAELAKMLGFGDRFCVAPKADELTAGRLGAGLTVSPAAFCNPTTPIRLELRWSFQGCGFELSAAQKKMMEEIGRIGAGERFKVGGYTSDVVPTETCFKKAQNAGLPDNANEPRSISHYGVTPVDANPVHTGLSFLRALAVAEAIASGMGGKGDAKAVEARVKEHFQLVAWGATQASKECAQQSGQDEQACLARDQRVELEASFKGYMFDMATCP